MKKHIIGTLLLGGWSLMMLTLLQSCDKQEVFSYESEHALFFERWKQVSLSELSCKNAGTKSRYSTA